MSEHVGAHAQSEVDVSRRRRDTQARLLDAATEVFAESGFQGASVELICSRADFTRGAFYSNFSSKEELFAALLRREYDNRAARIRARAEELAENLQGTDATITIDDAANYVSNFLSPTGDEAVWFALETEFLLLTLRDPEGPLQYVEFSALFRGELSNLVDGIMHSAGRRFTIPSNHALAALEGIFDQALRATALRGPDATEGLDDLGERMAELLFAITERV